jgi:hypothetical protein
MNGHPSLTYYIRDAKLDPRPTPLNSAVGGSTAQQGVLTPVRARGEFFQVAVWYGLASAVQVRRERKAEW